MPPSTTLGVDTATRDVAVGAMRDGRTVAERLVSAGEDRPRHAAVLMPEIERVVAECGGWGEVDLIAVGLGPGSFTGVRVGVATAKGLAQSVGLPLAGVCTLDALALGIGERPQAAGRARLGVIDARRSEAFAVLHDPSGRRAWGPLVCAPAALAERVSTLPAPPLAGGDGAIRFRQDLEAAGAEVLPEGDSAHHLAARHLCLLAGEVGKTPPDEVRPIYLRAPDAQVWLQRDRERRGGE